jgi:signal transduction histidine kinase/ActR/RegA family two-component response regulator
VTGMSRFWKLTPFFALTMVLILLAVGTGTVIYGERSYREQKTNEVTVQARILASSVTAALVFNDAETAQEQVNSLKANAEILAAAVYDANGVLVASYSREDSQTLPQTAQPRDPYFEDDRLIVAIPVALSHLTLGTIYVRSITEPVATRFSRYGLIGLLVFMAALVVGVLGVAQSALGRANAELQYRAHDLAAANAQLHAQIAEREKAEEALRQSQKMEAIGQLSGGIAHDFNNLLTVIRGNLQLLQKRLLAGRTDVTQYVDLAMDGISRATSVTQRILAFSRRQPLSPKPVDLSGLIHDMEPLMNHSIGARITLDLGLRSDWWTLCDPNQMENVVLNLVINARDSMPEGGRITIQTLNVTTEVSPDAEYAPGDYVRLSVIDTGSGMTEEVKRRAIDPFFTTKPIGQGTGLGLSMVFGYIKQSHGHLIIDSALGAGTSISILMPRYRLESDTDPVAPPEEPKRPEAAPKSTAPEKRSTVLIVEDEYLVRMLAAETIREEGYDVIEEGDGIAAHRVIESDTEIDLLITDVKLPGMGGYQLAEKALASRPNLKVMVVTGYTQDPLPLILEKAGVKVLHKPYDLETLASTTHRLLKDAAGA